MTAPTDRVDVWGQVTDQQAEPGTQVVPAPGPSHSQLEVWHAEPVDATVVRLTLALLDQAVAVIERALGRPAGASSADAVLGGLWGSYRAGRAVVGIALIPARPLGRLLAEPPLVPPAARPAAAAAALGAAWRAERPQALWRLARARDAVVPAVVDAAMQPIDVTALVLESVDLRAIATAVLDQLDLTAVARDRIDLAGLAQNVIDEIDLPEIIRASTGSVASETVRSVRMQSINADQTVQRVVDRLAAWRNGRDTQAPSAPAEEGQ